MLRTNWIFRDLEDKSTNMFLELIETLDGVDDPTLYTTEFVRALVQEFWNLYNKVFDFVFIPFIIQSLTCVIYFSYYIQLEEDHRVGCFELIIKITVYITTVYFFWLETL